VLSSDGITLGGGALHRGLTVFVSYVTFKHISHSECFLSEPGSYSKLDICICEAVSVVLF
jgi:hypothetical protein